MKKQFIQVLTFSLLFATPKLHGAAPQTDYTYQDLLNRGIHFYTQKELASLVIPNGPWERALPWEGFRADLYLDERFNRPQANTPTKKPWTYAAARNRFAIRELVLVTRSKG